MNNHARVWVTTTNPDLTELTQRWNMKTGTVPLPLHDFPAFYRRFEARNTLWGVLMDVRKGGLEDIIIGKPQSSVVRSHARKVHQVMHIQKTPHQQAINEALAMSLGGWSTDLLPGETKHTSPSVMLDVFSSEGLAREAEAKLRDLWFLRGIEFGAVEVVFSQPF